MRRTDLLVVKIKELAICFIICSMSFLYIPEIHGMTAKGTVVLNEKTDLNNQFTKSNTSYIIKRNFKLKDGEIVKIPSNSSLVFKGGSITGNGTIIGQGTEIKAGLMPVFSLNITISGSWKGDVIYPEWFGAKGDGLADDTKAIRKSLSTAGFDTCFFQNKVYIINMEKLSDPSRPCAIFDPVKVDNIIGLGNSTLRLGKGNCDVANGTGFAAVLYISGRRKVSVENLKFDYNYAENTPFQRGGRTLTVENNGQQCAVLFNNVESAVIRNCVFKDASGSNVISMWFGNSTDSPKFICENNTFVDFGRKSYFRAANGNEDAYHDVSAIGVHFNKGACISGRAKAVIRNNIANGIGGNAYNFCECHADETVFEKNVIQGFACCFMPLCARKDVSVLIRGNRFQNCINAIHFWNMPEDGFPVEYDTYGYKDLIIDNNYFLLDFKKWFETPLYNTLLYRDTNGYYYAGAEYYGAISQAGKGRKHIKSFRVTNNVISYDANVKDIPNDYFKMNYFSTINMYNLPGQPNVDNILKECVISDNHFENVPNVIFLNRGYNKVEKYVFSRNNIINAYSNPNKYNRFYGGGLLTGVVRGSNVHHAMEDGKGWLKQLIITDNTIKIDKDNYTNEYSFSILCHIENNRTIIGSEAIIRNNSIIGENYKELVKLENFERVINE